MAFPNFSGSKTLPVRTSPTVAGSDHHNPVADKHAAKRKKYNASMMGLKVAASPMASNAPKGGSAAPVSGGMSRGFPGAGVGGNV